MISLKCPLRVGFDGLSRMDMKLSRNHKNGLQNAIESRILMSNCQALKFSKFQNISLITFPICSDKSEIRGKLSSVGGLIG